METKKQLPEKAYDYMLVLLARQNGQEIVKVEKFIMDESKKEAETA